MKQINFIQTPDIKERIAMHRWFWFSSTLLISTLLLLSFIYAKQLHQYNELLKEVQQMQATTTHIDATLAEQHAIKQKEETLKTKIAKMARIKEQPKNPAMLMHALTTTLPQGMSLASLTLKKKHADLNYTAASTQDILNYIETLRKDTQFKQITLQSIEPGESIVKAHLEIELA